MVYAMRINNSGFSGLERFCSVMNLPKPMTRCNYDINVDDDETQVDTGVSVDSS